MRHGTLASLWVKAHGDGQCLHRTDANGELYGRAAFRYTRLQHDDGGNGATSDSNGVYVHAYQHHATSVLVCDVDDALWYPDIVAVQVKLCETR